jgi:hypothetical protein
VRSAFLRNPATRRCLELDAYSEEIQLGVEFHGVQHYEFPNPFHSTRAQFQRQQDRDKLKSTLCSMHGVRLLIVPHHVQRDDIETYLRNQLEHLGLLPVSESGTSHAAASTSAMLIAASVSSNELAANPQSWKHQ